MKLNKRNNSLMTDKNNQRSLLMRCLDILHIPLMNQCSPSYCAYRNRSSGGTSLEFSGHGYVRVSNLSKRSNSHFALRRRALQSSSSLKRTATGPVLHLHHSMRSSEPSHRSSPIFNRLSS